MEMDRFRSPNIMTAQVEPAAARCRYRVGNTYTAPQVLKNIHHELPYRVRVPLICTTSVDNQTGKAVVKEETDKPRSKEAKQWCLETFGEPSFHETEAMYYGFVKNARWAPALMFFYFRRPEDLLLYQLTWR